MVLFLVLVGVVFSWLQFRAAAYQGATQEMDASMAGVKITSSTLGVVILLLSMCFFYLYLRFVYPITNSADAHGPDHAITETQKPEAPNAVKPSAPAAALPAPASAAPPNTASPVPRP